MGAKYWMQRWWMFNLSSYLPSLMTNLSSHPQFVLDNPWHWLSASWEHIGILGVLEHRSLLVPTESRSYFPKDILLLLSEVCTPNIFLDPSIHILGFLSSHIYNLCFDPASPFFNFKKIKIKLLNLTIQKVEIFN